MGRLGIVGSSAFFLRISGPAIKSWSIVLEPNQTIAETTAKLESLRNKITINNSTIALSLKPSSENELDEQRLSKIEIFNAVFPKVPLTTIFTEDEFFQIGVDSISCGKVGNF